MGRDYETEGKVVKVGSLTHIQIQWMCINHINLCCFIICIHSNVAKVRCLDHGGKAGLWSQYIFEDVYKGSVERTAWCCSTVPLNTSIFVISCYVHSRCSWMQLSINPTQHFQEKTCKNGKRIYYYYKHKGTSSQTLHTVHTALNTP